jgi:hypothetical protein
MTTSTNEVIGLTRRRFLATTAALVAAGRGYPALAVSPYGGPYLMTIHAGGGWDLSLFCDPKTNVPGELPITDWSETGEIQAEGNILYAPIASNGEMFRRIAPDSLVINGVDTQTNAHQTGERHTWTGSASEGRPSLAALYAGAKAPNAPIALINNGTFGADQGLVRTARTSPGGLRELLRPRNSDEESLLVRYKARGLDLMAAQDRYNAGLADRLSVFRSGMDGRALLGSLYDNLPLEMPQDQGVYQGSSDLKSQILTGLVAFKTGTTASAECAAQGNWDTHSSGEFSQVQNIQALNEALIYLWNMAEELEVRDKLVVVVSSDFGRTPYYNSYGGKDHWPINSYLIMQGDAEWGGRTVGKTDALQNGIKIDPITLKESPSASLIYPKHVHHALHHYLGIAEFAAEVGYGFPGTEHYDFFNPNLST